MKRVNVITGTSKGIGKYLVEYYLEKGDQVIGCSRSNHDFDHPNYSHYELDVSDELSVKELFLDVSKRFGHIDILINNAGIASMNHFLLTPLQTANRIMHTNYLGTFLFCKEAAKIMKKNMFGRIVNFTSVATPLKLEGEASYAASKAAIETLTKILARELSEFKITVNAIGPTPVKTDIIKSVPQKKLDRLIEMQPLHRFGEFVDISNVIDFFIQPESDFITGQIIYLGGIG